MRAIRGVFGTLGELVHFLWQRRLWWLLPMIIVLILFAALIVLGSAAGIGPFIYTLF
jgi:hypothetical protein